MNTSDVWIKAQDELQKQRQADGCMLERVIAGLMFSSDSTQLTQFTQASAWPVYMSFRNLSKYIRARPNTPGACHLVAIMPKVSRFRHLGYATTLTSAHLQLPHALHSFISQLTSKKDLSDILTHCKRELMHAIWKILLDDEFVEAYKNGIVLRCHDSILRRVFPRIFTYSADYPEK